MTMERNYWLITNRDCPNEESIFLTHNGLRINVHKIGEEEYLPLYQNRRLYVSSGEYRWAFDGNAFFPDLLLHMITAIRWYVAEKGHSSMLITTAENQYINRKAH